MVKWTEGFIEIFLKQIVYYLKLSKLALKTRLNKSFTFEMSMTKGPLVLTFMKLIVSRLFFLPVYICICFLYFIYSNRHHL